MLTACLKTLGAIFAHGETFTVMVITDDNDVHLRGRAVKFLSILEKESDTIKIGTTDFLELAELYILMMFSYEGLTSSSPGCFSLFVFLTLPLNDRVLPPFLCEH